MNNDPLSGLDKFRLPRPFAYESTLPVEACAQRLREIAGTHQQLAVMQIERKSSVVCAGEECTFTIETVRRYSSQGRAGAGRSSEGATNVASGTLKAGPAGTTRIEGSVLFGYGGYLRALATTFGMLIFWLISVLATGIAQNAAVLVVWTLVALFIPGIFWFQLLSDRQTLLRMIAEAAQR